MTALASASDLINALTDGTIADLDNLAIRRTGGSSSSPQTRLVHKEWRSGGAAQTASVAGQWHSFWTLEGIPSHGAVPTSWANPDNTTPGGWMQANASGGRALFLTSLIGAVSASPGVLMVYDRLGHMSGMTGTSSGVQNVNGGLLGSITRYTNGLGNFAALEIYTSPGNTAAQSTFQYNDQAAASQTSDVATIGGAGRTEAGRFIIGNLASGTYGVQGVTSITNNSSQAGTGNYGVVIGHPLYYLTFGSGPYASATSFVNGPIAKVLASACVALAWLPALASSPITSIFSEILEA